MNVVLINHPRSRFNVLNKFTLIHKVVLPGSLMYKTLNINNL
ncbi:hypothetical protein SHLI107390_05975 [Shewanella livingstonensis]